MANQLSPPGMPRIEDERLLRGAGSYTDDLAAADALHAVVLRSPHAAAGIRGIDTAAAAALPGVRAIYTAQDLVADGIGAPPCIGALGGGDGASPFAPPRPVLAERAVRHVGDPVAFIVATDINAARDAAEAVRVDYEPHAAVVDCEAALETAAPAVWDEAPGNRAFAWEIGRKDETEALFAAAAHVTRLRVVNNRVVAAPMEPRAASADYDAATRRWTLRTNSQGGWLLRELIATAAFKVPADRFRIVTPDVGGSFGTKIFPYPEHVLTCYAARKLGRPVRWSSERMEAFLSDAQGRDNVATGELALDADHRFLALRVRTTANMGAYLSTFAPLIPTVIGTAVLSSVYDFRSIHCSVVGAFTNTVPVDAYRGAGMPESIYLVERLVDAAAAELGLDRAALRRLNLVGHTAMPYKTALGGTYDSGDFPKILDIALARSDWADFPARRAEAAGRDRHRGIGLACYLASTGGPPNEQADIRFPVDGTVELRVGTQSTGQGHATAYSQLLAARLSIPVGAIRVVQGDTDLLANGGGTGGSRSLYAGGAAILSAVASVIENGKVAASEALEVAAEEIVFADGAFTVIGTDRAIGLLALAAVAGSALDASATADTATATFPNGCHVAEVEIDPECGTVELLRYVATDDVGRVHDGRLVLGQIQGGIVQGYGQAVRERTVFDPGSGQLLSGSFMDYALPRAGDVPAIEVELVEIPCASNAIGAKGAGEAGTVGSAPAIMSAILDALSVAGVRHLDMPATPQRIWEALQRRDQDESRRANRTSGCHWRAA